MSSRPNNKEIINKLKEISSLIRSGRRRVLKPLSFQSQLRSLDLTAAEMWDVILEIIPEIKPLEHYKGGRPPQRSYEDDIKDIELWAYSWTSVKFNNQEIYLKFAIQDGVVWIVSFHYSSDKRKF